MEKCMPIDLTISKGSSVLSFGKFPFWQGLFDKPGIAKTLPFNLFCNPSGHIKLDSSAFEMNCVIDVYQESDYNFITKPPGSSAWSNLLGDTSVSWVKKLIPADIQVNNVLEIGAGSLYVAQSVKKLMNIEKYFIVDPSIRESSDDFEIIREYFPSKKTGNLKFDLILAFNTLEHLPEPESFLNSIKDHLTEKGLVVLTFPDCERQLRLGDFNVLLHEHINYFTESSMIRYIEKGGFELVEYHTFDDTFVVLIKLNENIKELEASLSNDNEFNLLKESEKAFKKSIDEMKVLIDEQISLGNNIGFHGATNGLNTLLFLLGLENETSIRIYDGDQNKVGKYLPSFHGKILSSQDASYAANSIMIVSAITYFDSISKFAIQQHGLTDNQIYKIA
jgi:SAM-dependent methyltransferase